MRELKKITRVHGNIGMKERENADDENAGVETSA